MYRDIKILFGRFGGDPSQYKWKDLLRDVHIVVAYEVSKGKTTTRYNEMLMRLLQQYRVAPSVRQQKHNLS
jgi:hypothetical protein